MKKTFYLMILITTLSLINQAKALCCEDPGTKQCKCWASGYCCYVSDNTPCATRCDGSCYWSQNPCPGPFDFSVSVNPSAGNTTPGGSVATTVTATLTSGNPQSVSFSCSNLPSGTSCSFNPSSCSPTCSSTLTISTSSTTPTGTYSITVTGTGGGLTRTATYTLTVAAACRVGAVCNYGPWSCSSNCARVRDVYVYDSSCNCVYNRQEIEYAPRGEYCSGGSFYSGYCYSSPPYCSQDRYKKVDRYQCDGSGNCIYLTSDILQDCGATSYSCLSSCVKRYTYTCSAGTCGTYTADYNCPQDTSCSGGTCSSNTACLTGSYECKDSCTKGQKQYRCDGSGNCNRFWQWVNLASCNPFSCSAGSCSNTCSAACEADSACDGKTPGSSCGTGKECNSNCQCVVVACSGYTSSSTCNADPNCAWCSGDNTCKAKSAVVCQPPSCSADSKSKCTSSCTWQDCGSTDSSCYCSAGSCIACSGSTPYCNNYACVQCLSNTQGQKDCPKCYQRCDLSTYTCYDFRPSLTGTCAYYDYCTSSTCASNPEYCYNAEPSLCQDSNWKCHAWFSC